MAGQHERGPGIDSRSAWVRIASRFLPAAPGHDLPDTTISDQTFEGHLERKASDAIRYVEAQARQAGFEVRPRTDGLRINPPFQLGLSYWRRPAMFVRIADQAGGSRLECRLTYLGGWLPIIWTVLLLLFFVGDLVARLVVTQPAGTPQAPHPLVFIGPLVLLALGWLLDRWSRLSQAWNRAGLVAIIQSTLERLST